MGKIGLFGGTYDPIHVGHIEIANKAMDELNLDTIYFIPTGKSYFKENVLSSDIRLNMVKSAIDSNDKFKLSDCEIKRAGNTYSIDTVKFFRKQFPDDELFFIMGMDSFRLFHKWKSYKDILELATLVVAPRTKTRSDNTHEGIIDNEDVEDDTYFEEMCLNNPDAAILRLHMDKIDISSTDLRNILKNKEYDKARNYIPSKTLEYIIKEGIYNER